MRLLLLILCLVTTVTVRASDDTYNGQPVGPNLPADDAIGFINLTVQNWLDSHPGQHKIDQQSVGALTPVVQRLGIANLEAAYRATAADTVYQMNVSFDAKEELKRLVLEKAISLTAAPADIDALLVIYVDRPLIDEVFNDHPQWDSNASVTNFLAGHLDHDAIEAAYQKSDIAPRYLLILAARSHASSVQDKFDALLTDLAQNGAAYKNAHIYTDLISVNGFTPNDTIKKHLSDLLVALAGRVQFPPQDVYNEVQAYSVFSQQLANQATNNPTLFAASTTKEAVLKMVDQAQASGSVPNANLLIVAAACGSKDALAKLAALNNPEAKKYLATQPGVTDHIDAAVYDPTACTWSVPPTTATN